jgi:hypothetical protein
MMLRKTLIMVVLVASVGATVSVAAQDGQTGASGVVGVEEGQAAVNETERPDELIKRVSDGVYLAGSDYDEGDVVLRLASRSSGETVEVEDGMSDWDAQADEYDETFTLDEGVTTVRVPDVGTLSPEGASNEFWGVMIRERGGDGVAAATGTVGWAAHIPSPPGGAGAAAGITLTAVGAFGSIVALLKRYANVPASYDIKPDRSFLRWLKGGGRR